MRVGVRVVPTTAPASATPTRFEARVCGQGRRWDEMRGGDVRRKGGDVRGGRVDVRGWVGGRYYGGLGG